MATKKVYSNTLAQIAGKVATALISIFLIKILTNYLDVAGYGLYSKVYNYLSIFSVIADLGLYTITVREISAHKDNHEKVQGIVGNILTLRTFFGGMIIFLSLAIGFLLPGYNSPMAMAGILITGVFTLFGLMNSSVMSLLQAHLKTEFSFVSVTTGKMVNFLAILLIVFVLLPKGLMSENPILQFWGFVAILLAGLLGNVVMTGLLYFYARKIEPIRFRFDPVYMKHILKISLPYGIALFLNVIYFKVDIVLLSILEPQTVADISIALYSVPMKIVEVGMMFGTLFLNSMLPLFTEAIKKNSLLSNPLLKGEGTISPLLLIGKEVGGGGDSNPELLSYVAKAYKILLIFGVGIASFLFVNDANVLSFIATPEYIEQTKYLYTSLDAMKIVVFIFLFYFLSSLFTYLLIAHDEQKKLLKINLIITVANLVGNIALIPFYSFVGSAWVTLACQVFLLLFTYRATRNLVRFNFLPSFTLSTIFFAILASGINWYILQIFQMGIFLSLLICATVFSLIYLGGIGGVWFLGKTKLLK
ncbi:MAG: oligosaccharide flippase family protein [Candidatus Gracilibacteria bacterium]|nr:oligosaccharide flippase family protein [Candidatus Gracilibacteria bacterium]